MAHVLPDRPIANLDEYLAVGGGNVLERCQALGPAGVVSTVRSSGLRGRGGAGFPTGVKWGGLAAADATSKFVVCNAAEGEPGTFKDRTLIRRDPYRVIEGVAAAVYATGATRAYIGIKEKFSTEIVRLEQAVTELAGAGLLGNVEMVLVPGPDDYLFGEEKGMLEVIEGKDPLPRLFPPYVQGLFEVPGGPAQPALVNNVETFAHAAHILVNGADWYRSLGTAESPGTVVCTVSGDVVVEGVAEFEMGTPLRTVLETVGGGTRFGRPVKLVMNGVSTAPLSRRDLDVPVAFEAFAALGSALGSASFIVFEEPACAAAVAAAASAFLFRGSCGQCPPCKLGTAAITERFVALAMGGRASDLEEIAAWNIRVTDANRCGLGSGQQEVARGIMARFPEDLAEHIAGTPCPTLDVSAIATIEDWDETAGRFSYGPPVLEDASGG